MGNDVTIMAEKLELHFDLAGGVHKMDAFVKNKCEAELLFVISELATILGLAVNCEAEALAEGGLSDYIKLAFEKHPVVASIFIGVLINVVSNTLTTDKELIALQKTECRLQIEKLRRELNGQSHPLIDRQKEKLVESIIENQKIRKRRSNFFQQAIKCKEISAVDFYSVDAHNKRLESRKSVRRADFDKYVLITDELEPLIDEKATIEIVAPVLKKRKYTWRGIYKGEVISFVVNDSNFRAQVVSGELSFSNGISIDGVLKIFRKLDQSGVELITGYAVEIVLRVHNSQASKITPQGRAYKRKRQTVEKKYVEQDLFDI